MHWGTFNLALHAWDEPAEALLRLAPEQGAHLVMPLLGEPVEPSRAPQARPWWRAVTAGKGPERTIAAEPAEEAIDARSG